MGTKWVGMVGGGLDWMRVFEYRLKMSTSGLNISGSGWE